jgi:hypothetical protein
VPTDGRSWCLRRTEFGEERDVVESFEQVDGAHLAEEHLGAH